MTDLRYRCTHMGEYHTHMCKNCGAIMPFGTAYCNGRTEYDPCTWCGKTAWTLDIVEWDKTMDNVIQFPTQVEGQLMLDFTMEPEMLEIMVHPNDGGIPLIEVSTATKSFVVESTSEDFTETLDYVLDQLIKEQS